MSSSIFQINKKSHVRKEIFFDEPVDVARYDIMRYPQFDKLTEMHHAFFWRPHEIDLSKDRIDFDGLNDAEKHIFTSNLQYQILMDSVQGRAPNLLFLPIVSIPEFETFVETWSFSETIHSRSYTHILRNVYTDPSVVFDGMTKIQEIVDRAATLTEYYDDAMKYMYAYKAGVNLCTEYELAKKVWLAINSVNILEGIRFFNSFICSWAFAENEKMVGNATIIKLICRDESLHLAATQYLIRVLKRDSEMFARIAEECADEVHTMFMDAMQQEFEWADYLFQYGSVIGLNADILKDYAKYITAKRMISIDIEPNFEYPSANPVSWSDSWISSSDVQVAPQETEISSYIIGALDNTLNKPMLLTLEAREWE